ncbi:MAG TPA: O-antigen ligase family protein [Synergistales bacterium]|nr:O-antigen ligase family protein [Synergistales bacterium]HRS48161.1 O-antigen ligase family protein [Thermovirgaceae bacterium]HRU90645.1 O-antigen ligase family protein [Thermovirgaceae bacterium]
MTGGPGDVGLFKGDGPFRSGKASLVPEPLATMILFFMLSVPNLVFSGPFWYEALHLMKWAAVFVPVGFLIALAGMRIVLMKGVREDFLLDPFGAAWLFLVLFLILQPLWTPITSVPTFTREWLFFASLWGVYVITRNGAYGKSLPILLWLAALAGAVNVLFAELQVHGLHHLFPFVYPTPGKYIGNTGQQNMFGLWVAMVMMGSSWLFLRGGPGNDIGGSKKIAVAANLFLFTVNAWGLWNSTSRSAVFSYAVGLCVLASLVARSMGTRKTLARVSVILALLAATFSGTLLFGRGNVFIMKSFQMVEQFRTVGKRDSIWLTTAEMFKMHPLSGVGLGHYKWNYLEAQRRMVARHPGMKWQYTYWAHSEVFQWFCETGMFGGLALIALGAWWLKCFLSRLKRGDPLSTEGAWASSFLFLIWFDALWTRPFHRIEDVLWLAFAFGIANRELLPSSFPWTEIRKEWVLKSMGMAMSIVAVAGLFFFLRGMEGDRLLRRASLEEDPVTRTELIERAEGRLMVRDAAQRELAYQLIRMAVDEKRGELLGEGLTRLHQHFRQEPHARDLGRLLAWYSDVRETDLLESVARYLKPGAYSIVDGQLLLSSEDYRYFFGSE